MTSLAEIEPLKSLKLEGMLDVPPERIEQVEAKLLNLPQIDCPLQHSFAPGVYLRTITMPAGSFIIGHQHKTKHHNIILKGRAAVMMDGKLHDIIAPCSFVSDAGVRKVLYIIDEMQWATVHTTDSTDLSVIEQQVIEKSPSFVKHMEDMKQLKQIVAEASK